MTTRTRKAARSAVLSPEEARAVILDSISEDAFTAQVMDLARKNGWLAYHTWNSMHSAGGFPDVFCVRGSRAIAAELKRMKDRTNRARMAEQLAWLDAMAKAGIETHLWRPVDLHDGSPSTIERVLARDA